MMMSLPKILKFGFPSIIEKNSTTGDIIALKIRPKDLELANLIASALKVKYEIIQSTDGEFARMLDNGTFTGPVGLAQRDEVDLVICDLTITTERMTAVDFTYPFFFSGFTFATRKPQFSPKFSAVVHPFTKEVWISIVVCLVIMSLLFYVMNRKKHNFQSMALKTYGSFLSKCKVYESDEWNKRLLALFWEVGCMFITFSYTAVLLSFLTLPIRERGIQNIHELSDAIIAGEYHAATYKGNFIPEVLTRAEEDYLRVIGEDVKKHLVPYEETKDLLLHRDEKIALIAPRNYIAFLQNVCFIAEKNLFGTMEGMAFRKSFCCRNQLDAAIHKIFVAGLYAKLNDNFLFLSFLNSLSPEEKNEVAPESILNLTDLSGPFLFLILGYVVSTFVFILEMVIGKRQKIFKIL